MATPSIWRSRPIFITSTFRDMHAERDWLRTHVFPEIEERLRERFHYLETIDLRWGIDSASADQEHDREVAVLTVCLDEITRSRPFLIGLLGDRYGWRPSPERINGAAREAGIAEDLGGKSVTELEILHGVLRSPEQRHRSWFYLRDPLPYDSMPPAVAARYSDQHSGEADAAEKALRLRDLKQALRDALPGRVRTYQARWNTVRGAIEQEDLEAWGARVREDLWSDLETETAEFLREAPKTWHEQDRWTLGEFMERCARGFVGRTIVTRDLIAQATSPAAKGVTWGSCVTGEAGSGKSSLFGHLYRSLREEDALVLAHAAGISVRSTQVDWMLRRWVGELAAAVGQADPFTDEAKPDEIDQAFSRLLHHASQSRRVVVLIDALDQFEPTPRGTHLTWLPRLWPANARLIATAIPGTQSRALLQRPGTKERALIPIDNDEAAAIVRGICARYHRTLSQDAERALLAKRDSAGAPSFGNPLWLEVATEELNLLDAQAFDRADAHTSTGATGGDHVLGLLLSTVEQMPGNVPGLYGFMLNRAEQHFGQAWTRAFVSAVGVSRAGWRESDLEKLMPALSGEPWDPLRFATLRRGLRVHVVQRGAHAQWDFAHAQMRRAVIDQLARDRVDVPGLHHRLGDHLLGLTREDPLHETETMVHLMQAGDLCQAAALYGSQLTAGEAAGATAALSARVVSGGIHDIESLLGQGIDDVNRAVAGMRFLYELNDALNDLVPVDVRLVILQAAQRAFSRLAEKDPADRDWQALIAESGSKIAESMRAQGELDNALAAHRASQKILERLSASDPSTPAWKGGLAVTHASVGDCLLAKGDVAGAHRAYSTANEMLQLVVRADPSWESDLGSSFSRLGNSLSEQGDGYGALAAYQAAHQVHERRAAMEPHEFDHQRNLAVSHGKIGDALSLLHRPDDALRSFRSARDIFERLTLSDPANRRWRHGLAFALDRIGTTLLAQGCLAPALEACTAAHEILTHLGSLDSGNTESNRDIGLSHMTLGDVLIAQGRRAEAMGAFRSAQSVFERLASTDMRNAQWQRDLLLAYQKLAMLCAEASDPSSATDYQRRCRTVLAYMRANEMFLDSPQPLAQADHRALHGGSGKRRLHASVWSRALRWFRRIGRE